MTTTQQQEAWDKIHKNPPIAIQRDWHEDWRCKKDRPYTYAIGRSHAKGKAGAVGQILKKSFVKAGVHIERVFSVHKL